MLLGESLLIMLIDIACATCDCLQIARTFHFGGSLMTQADIKICG
jgi:hypothetical protein